MSERVTAVDLPRRRLWPLALATVSDLGLLAALLGAGVAAVTLLRAVQSNGFYWADDYVHLLISRSVPGDPSAVLDVWGRPLMTLTYLPASFLGHGAVRLTSLVLLLATATLCWDIARRRGIPAAPTAALFLLVQPLTVRLGFAALPESVFSFVLALALWLEASGRTDRAALVVSLLPLARLEGLLVVLIWGGYLLSRRRQRELPLLAIGMASWALLALGTFGDPLWLFHHSPYGVFRNPFHAHAGWTWLPRVWPKVFGPVVGVLSLAAFVRPRRFERIDAWLVVAFAVFFILIWGVPLLGSVPTGVYLVDLSVPLALCACRALASVRAPVAHALVLAAAAAAIVTIAPLRLSDEDAAAHQLAERMAASHLRVDLVSYPSYAWFAEQLDPARAGAFLSGETLRSAIEHAAPGSRLVWDPLAGANAASSRELRSWGYSPELDRGQLVVWVRRSQSG